jgi:hypothetical protein
MKKHNISIPQILLLGSATSIALLPYTNERWEQTLCLVTAFLTIVLTGLMVIGNHRRAIIRHLHDNQRIIRSHPQARRLERIS